MTIRRALISVSDKTGIADLGRALAAADVQILSTGGTAKALVAAGVPVTKVSDHTGSPEVFGGRVKTLHPKIHGGILFNRALEAHVDEAQQQGIDAIDLVVVNLYPFAETIAKPGCTRPSAVEQIDIGGPCMVRAAAKNHASVSIIVDPTDYQVVVDEIQAQGNTSLTTREKLAAKAFEHTAGYDRMIADYLTGQGGDGLSLPPGEALRYGENPHQDAGFHAFSDASGPCGCEQLSGKALSYNNLLDLDAALCLTDEFNDENAVAIIKHCSPCGVARIQGDDVADCFEKALACDPVSAFGSIVSFTRPLDLAAAEALCQLFVEVVAAPGYSDEALERLMRRKNLRIMRRLDGVDTRPRLRSVQGGLLVQGPDLGGEERRDVVTERSSGTAEKQAMELAWKVVKHVRSNAIVFANAEQAVGIGGGQTSRVDAAELAVKRALLPLEGTAVGSDAFFPFRDGLDVLAKAGATAVIQPGGSKRDDEVIEAANGHGMTMVFTGTRHFRH
ncbi:MAG TPA: bifunctional phosphoribosylaminoimidazolecarboxamide formyltransferase/inosine monophosphate cyclohydrolase [Myxococcales bacterium]|nr:bifunctional phosphoribosylaminoimidazolecarboxamide formyltransferase/inosine monophosphate cyclohydrolase [Myxococcales bacterium]